MPGIILFTLVVAVVVIAILYLHDTRRAREARDDPPAAPPPTPPPAAPAESGELLGSEDIEALASHVRELRRAVDEGLIGREEAVASIVRHADGRVGEGAAEQLLDSAELD